MAADILLMRRLNKLRVIYQSHSLSVQRRERLSLAQNPLKEQVSVNLSLFEGPVLKEVTLAFNHLH